MDCWIAKYFDADPSEGAHDYTGGYRTNNNHTGTDFAVRDLAAMNAGVAVLAAADGTVRAVRSGMEDVNVKSLDRDAVEGLECGNGVVVNHGPGWATQYCHLRMGSLRVRKGQQVKAGDVIGLIGQSGFAEFPHVHFSVLRDGKHIDPFAVADDKGGTSQIWSPAAQRQHALPRSCAMSRFRSTTPGFASPYRGKIRRSWGSFPIKPSGPIHRQSSFGRGCTAFARAIASEWW